MKRSLVAAAGIGALLLAGFLTFQFTAQPAHQSKAEETCSGKPPLKAIDTSEPHLKTLAAYQKACGSLATDTMMFFINFPANETAAAQSAAEVAKRLKQFNRSGVRPIVIVEPYVGARAMPYRAYLAGSYDKGVNRFFKHLKARGISSGMMGTWVPFPEPNTPLWNNKNTTPEDFAHCVNKYLGTMKRYFPGAEGSVLLNAATYAPTDTEWEHGAHASLAEYVQGLDDRLVSSFGIQGFPWPDDNGRIPAAADFIQPDLAVSATKMLGTHELWINTGTFASTRIDGPAKTIRLSPAEREALLRDILGVAKGMRDRQEGGYHVSINLFSEDKSSTEEATDWSYLKDPETAAVLKNFLSRANELNLPVSLFDKAK